MTDIIDRSMHIAHSFTIRDIALYKIYLCTLGLLAVLLFPSLGTISRIVYIASSIIMLSLFGVRFLQQKQISRHSSVQLFRRCTRREIALFKTGMLIFGIGLALLFPVLLTAPFSLYIGLCAFGIGYFVSMLLHSS